MPSSPMRRAREENEQPVLFARRFERLLYSDLTYCPEIPKYILSSLCSWVVLDRNQALSLILYSDSALQVFFRRFETSSGQRAVAVHRLT